MDVVQIQVKDLAESPTNPRTDFPKAAQVELESSIKINGILDPLKVRKAGSGYEIVDGARRYRAAKQLKIPAVACLVVELTDAEVSEHQLISHVQRTDITPMEESRALQQLWDGRYKNMSLKALAERVGKSAPYVAQRMQLTNLINGVADYIENEQMSLDAALQVARLPKDLQQVVLLYLDDEDHPDRYFKADEISQFIKRELMTSLSGAPFKPSDDSLTPGTCSDCLTRTGANADLFSDIGKDDRCLNLECFKKKVDQHIARVMEEAEAEGKPLTPISDGYSKEKGVDALNRMEYQEASKKEANARGIFVTGNKRGTIIPIVIRAEAKKKAADVTSKPDGKAEQAAREERFQRRMEIWNNKVEKMLRQMMLAAVLPKIKKVVATDLRRVTNWLVFHHSNQVDVLEKVLGLKTGALHGGILDPDGEARFKALDAFNEAQLTRVCIAVHLLGEERIDDPSATARPRPQLTALCEEYDVDIKALIAKAQKELDAEKPKPPKGLEQDPEVVPEKGNKTKKAK